MAELDSDKSPDSKWFWIMLLMGLLVLAVLWFANPLGSVKQTDTTTVPASAQSGNPVDPASAVPLTLPTTAP